jgi:hypothetical protein
MTSDPRWIQCVSRIRAGERIIFDELEGGPLVILASDLRRLLTGADQGAAVAGAVGGGSRARTGQGALATAIHIDGGTARGITLVADTGDREDPVIDLADLRTVTGVALPPLVLKNCRIEGWLDFSGSHLTSLSLSGCEARGVRGNACQIDGDCRLIKLRPLGISVDESSLQSARHDPQPCQVTMVAARIDGSVDLRNSLLRSPMPTETGRESSSPSLIWTHDFADQFALSLASSEIRGRLLLLGDFEAWGGVSLYQAEIRNSIRITSRVIAAHEVREFPGAPVPRRKYSALDASELRLEGNLIWAPDGDAKLGGEGSGARGNVFGNIKLVRAQIEGDVFLQNIQWATLPFCNDGRLVAEKTQPAYLPSSLQPARREDAHASGGIDGRYARIGGQLRIGGRCQIGRRYRPMTGLAKISDIGPSLDFWKATFRLGMRLDSGAQLRGPALFTATHIGRHIYIAAEIVIESAKRPRLCPYHTALDLSDSRLDGNMILRIPRLDGRVSLSRMQIDGSMEIQSLHFRHKGVRRANYALRDEVGEVAHRNALRRERFDETSILDCQDLSLSGGINLKRDSISVDHEDRDLPYNRFIVDLRGTSCSTWDDADCTCWHGLDARRTARWTPWRLRFDGISFKGLDSSNQHYPIRPETIAGSLWGRLAARFYRERSYMAASSREIIAFRIRALNSFHDNRNRTAGPPRPEAQGGGSDEVAIRWPKRLYAAFMRTIVGPSWQMREEVPDHSPQPYEVFARAYMARGEGDTAISLAMERVRLQWRRRLRDMNRLWSRLYLVGIGGLIILLPLHLAILPEWRLPLWSLMFVILLTPILIGLGISIWRTGFGYGMHSGRALITVCLFLLIVAFGTPGLMGERISNSRDAREHLLYALDKLLPVINLDNTLYPRVVCVQPRSERALSPRLVRVGPQAKSSAEGPVPMQVIDTTDPPSYHVGSTHRPCLSRDLDRLYDLLGWLVLSLSILTLSGLLRRDVERSVP